jgi:PEP-CTERM motif
MRRYIAYIVFGFLGISSNASATTFTFATDPFAGSTALTTPGRQIVGGEEFIVFDIAGDLFALDPNVFGVGTTVLFANDVAGNLPTSNVNVIVLQSFDNDNDPATPFAAGNAANLIADRITSAGPGFFVYFNQGLDLPRLVFSTDLNENTSDLKILFRLTNLTGQAGRDAIPTFTAANFAFVPEPSTFLLTAAAISTLGYVRRRQRTRG